MDLPAIQQQAATTPMSAGIPRPVAVVFPSRSGGAPHVVTVLDTEPGALSCTCPAFRAINTRPSGCWAMKEVRRWLSLPTPAVVVESEVHADTDRAKEAL
jgi:hypothetical protein